MKVICTAATLKDTIKELKANGYEWICGNVPPELIIETLPNTKYIIIDASYNETRKRKEMQYQSERWYKENKLL